MVCLERRKHFMFTKTQKLKQWKAEIRERDWKDQKTGNPKETEQIDEKKPFTSNIFMFVVVVMKQKQRNKARKNSKKNKKGHKKKQKNKEGQKINKRKRETGNEKEKWRKPRTKKLRHWEMNKNNPFSGGKTVFL